MTERIEKTEIILKLDTDDISIVDGMMKKMLTSLTVGELEHLIDQKVTQTIMYVEVDNEVFNKKNGQK